MPLSTDAIYAIIESEGIAVEWQWLSSGILAVYARRPHWRCPVIVLSHTIGNYERVVRSLLLEELGHHRTSAGNHVDVRTYAQRIAYTKAERAALTEAARLGCPEDEFLNLVSRHYDLDDIADHFWITRELAKVQWERLLLKEALRKVG